MTRSPLQSLESDPGPECAWQVGFEYVDLRDDVLAAAVFDDGSGPALFIGGRFADIGTHETSYVARWQNGAWLPVVGSQGSGTDGVVRSLLVWDDGSGPALYAGGSFTTAGGVPANHVARWDGSEWSGLVGPLENGTSGDVRVLAVHDDGSGEALYVGGTFEFAGGLQSWNIARWDRDGGWSPLSDGTASGLGYGASHVASIASFDDGDGAALYATGFFLRAGGVTNVSSIARWHEGSWSPLVGTYGEGLSLSGSSLVVFDDGTGPALYVGGPFGRAGGDLQIKRVARWDGDDWSALTVYPDHLEETVNSLAVFDDGGGAALFAGGDFTSTFGGEAITRVAKFAGGKWQPLSGPEGQGTNGSVRTLAALDLGDGPQLFVGGGFRMAGGVSANHVAIWDGSAWSPLWVVAAAGFDGKVHALLFHDDGSGPALVAGGHFSDASGNTVLHVARWSRTVWTPLSGPNGTGTDGPVYSLATFDDGNGTALYVGGDFNHAGVVPAESIARWNGLVWESLTGENGAGLPPGSLVRALAVYDDGSGPALYVGGYFATADGVAVNNVARWDGSSWAQLPGPSSPGVNNGVHSIAVHNDGTGSAMFLGGAFSTAGGLAANHIARWDGSAWQVLYGPLAAGTTGPVNSLRSYDSDGGPILLAGGGFTAAGGIDVSNIAQWNGVEWSPLLTPSGPGVNDEIFALEFADIGDGASTLLGGDFTLAGGVATDRLCTWDEVAFSSLDGGPGPDDTVRALAWRDGALYVGGDFASAGGSRSDFIAKWSCQGDLFFDGFDSGDTRAWSATEP